MPTARQQELIAILKLEDQLSPGAARAKASLNSMEGAVGSLDQRLAGARSGIGKFAAAGAQLNLIASTLGPAFGGAVGPIGDTVRVLGNAGLIASTFAEIGPAAARGIGAIAAGAAGAIPGLAGMGAAGLGAATELSALTVAEDAAAAAAGRLGVAAAAAQPSLIGLLGPLALVGAVGVGAAVALDQFEKSLEPSAAEKKLEEAARGAALVKGLFGDLSGAAAAMGAASTTAATGIDTLSVAILSARDAADGFIRPALTISEALRGIKQNAADKEIKDQAQALFDGEEAAKAFQQGLSDMKSVIDKDIDPVLRHLIGTLDDLPKTVDIDINLKINRANIAADVATAVRIAQLGEGPEATNKFGGATVEPFTSKIPIIDPGVAAFLEGQRQEAIARAKEQATEEARARAEIIGNEFRDEKRLADTLFDALHDRTVKAIQDAEKLAQTKHDAALQAISDQLKEEQAAHAAPVNAAEQALQDREQQQRRRDLIEAQQAAQSALSQNRDPARQADLEKSLRSATEALVNFDAQAAIDRLRAVQAGLDATSQGTANAATKVADDALAAAKLKAQQQTDAETVANQKRREQFDLALQKLQEADLKSGKTPTQVQADIDKLAARFGITIDPITGFHHITDPLVTAIKNVKIEPPKVTFNPTFKPTFKVNGRDIAIELQSGAQPASTANVRSGNSGR